MVENKQSQPQEKKDDLPCTISYMSNMNKLHEHFQKQLNTELVNETETIANAQYEQCKQFNKEVMTEATQLKEQQDALLEKIRANHNA